MKREWPPFPRPATLAGIQASSATSHPVDYLASLHDARWGRDRLPDRAERRVIAKLMTKAEKVVLGLGRDGLYGDHCYARIEQTYHHPLLRLHYLPPLEWIVEWLRLRDLLVVDCETTGLHTHRGDRIVSLAVLDAKMRGPIAYPNGGGPPYVPQNADRFQIRAEHGWVFNPEGRSSRPEALAVHGLSDEELACAPTFAAKSDAIYSLLTRPDAVVIAHNAPFDIDFIRFEFFGSPPGRHGFYPDRELDTRALSKALWPGESASLDALAARLGVDVSERADRHTAGGDARILVRCLPGLLDATEAEIARRRKRDERAARHARRRAREAACSDA